MEMSTILVKKALDYDELFSGTKEIIRKFGGKIENVEIEKVIEMTKDEFNEFKKHLLKDQDFIVQNKEFTIFLVKEKDTENEKGIIVDTQGFDYPRYVGLSIVEEKFHKCSRCGNYFIGEPAISRKDNKSEVCSSCGIEEALEELEHKDIIMFCKRLQAEADKLGVDIIIKAKDEFERIVRAR